MQLAACLMPNLHPWSPTLTKEKKKKKMIVMQIEER